jgi:hypothetical protein
LTTISGSSAFQADGLSKSIIKSKMKSSAIIVAVLALSIGLAAKVQGQPRSITNQLVVHLTFDNTFNDNSGRGNNAAYNSANGLVTKPSAPTYVAGKIGQAFVYTTTADASQIEFASLGYPEDLKFKDAIDFSVAFWINTTDSASDPAIIANKNWNASANQGWGIFAQGGGNLRVQMRDANDSRLSTRPPNVIRDGAWHHVVMTYKRGATGAVKMYLDGSLINTAAYSGTGNIDTDDLLNGLGQPYAVNVGQDGTGAYTQANVQDVPPALAGGASMTAAVDDVGIWRRVLTDLEVAAMYNFGQKGTNLFNVPDASAPVLLSFSPNNGAVGVPPNVPVTARILDQGTQVNANSIQLFVDDVLVTHTLTKSGVTNTIAYTQPFLSAPMTTHTNRLIFADNATPTPIRSTNVNVYTVGFWTNNYLGTPLYYENFDALPLAIIPSTNLPTGWRVENCTDCGFSDCRGGWDLSDPRSDAYYDWQVVPVDTVATRFNYGSRILNVNGTIVVNGGAVPALGSNNIAFAASDQRFGSQIKMLFTRDYDLTGRSNIWVAFNSMYTQEGDQIAALEYSTNQGAAWLPIVYMLDGSGGSDDIIRDTNGVIDAYATFSTEHLDVAYCQASRDGNHYGAFIGVTSNLWPTLGPYISGRVQDDHVTYHQVERYSLPMADGQASVRFRFMLAASDSWVWGFDNFGIYSLPPTPSLQVTGIVRSSTNLTVNWNGTGGNFSGLQKSAALIPSNWVNVPGTIGQTSYTPAALEAAAYYRAVRF